MVFVQFNVQDRLDILPGDNNLGHFINNMIQRQCQFTNGIFFNLFLADDQLRCHGQSKIELTLIDFTIGIIADINHMGGQSIHRKSDGRLPDLPSPGNKFHGCLIYFSICINAWALTRKISSSLNGPSMPEMEASVMPCLSPNL